MGVIPRQTNVWTFPEDNFYGLFLASITSHLVFSSVYHSCLYIYGTYIQVYCSCRLLDACTNDYLWSFYLASSLLCIGHMSVYVSNFQMSTLCISHMSIYVELSNEYIEVTIS